MSDGTCTGWLDGIPRWLGGTGQEWLHCCLDHDAVAKTIAGDEALGACVRASEAILFGAINIAPLMGWTMQIGVETFGTFFVLITGGFGALKYARTKRKG